MRSLLLTGLMLASFLANAAAYRWVDEQGKVHYGDRPPAGAQRLKAPPPPAQAGQRESEEEAEAKPQQPASRSGKMSAAEACQEYKSRLARYNSTPHLAVRGEDGEQRMMSAQERQNLINTTKTRADETCALAETP